MQAQKNDTQLSFSIRNASLEEFIKYLENSTGFSFIYGEEVKINRRITLEVKQKTIREILDQAFKNEPIGYQIAGRHILLQKKKQKPVSRKFTISGYVTDGTSAETLIGANILESRHKQGTTTNPLRLLQHHPAHGRNRTQFLLFGIRNPASHAGTE